MLYSPDMRPFACLIALTLVCGCRESGPSPDPATAVVPEGSATAPAFEREGDTVPAKAEPAEAPEAEAPEVAKEEGDDAETETDQASEEAAPEALPEEGTDAPLPSVEVLSLIHI